LATSAGCSLSRSTRASSSCIASSVSGFWSASIVFARSAPAFWAVASFMISVELYGGNIPLSSSSRTSPLRLICGSVV
jgi:hypothetical protein